MDAFFRGRLKYFQGLCPGSSFGLTAEPMNTVGSNVSLKGGGKGKGMAMFSGGGSSDELFCGSTQGSTEGG